MEKPCSECKPGGGKGSACALRVAGGTCSGKDKWEPKETKPATKPKCCTGCRHYPKACYNIVGHCVKWDKWEPIETEKSCASCKHVKGDCFETVGFCDGDAKEKWEPKKTEQETNTILKETEMSKEQTYDYRIVGRKDDKIEQKIQAEDGGPLHVDAESKEIAEKLITEKHGAKVTAMRKKDYDVEYCVWNPFQSS